MPKPQMHAHTLLLRFGNVSKCHECGSLFDKTIDKLHVFGREKEDWWPKMNKNLALKHWC